MADIESPDDAAPEAEADATAATWRSFLDDWTPPSDDDADDPHAPDPEEDAPDYDEDLEDEHETDPEPDTIEEDAMADEDKAALDAYKALGDPKELASTLEAYKGLGDPKTLAEALTEREEATKQLAALNREKEVAAVAKAHGFDPDVLAPLAGSLAFEAKTVKDPKTAKESTAYSVKVDDKSVPLEEHFAKFLPALKPTTTTTTFRGTPPGPGGQPRPTIAADSSTRLPSLVS